jgi:hypothetical protein
MLKRIAIIPGRAASLSNRVHEGAARKPGRAVEGSRLHGYHVLKKVLQGDGKNRKGRVMAEKLTIQIEYCVP